MFDIDNIFIIKFAYLLQLKTVGDVIIIATFVYTNKYKHLQFNIQFINLVE
jgi:hypothetical protein